MLTMQFYFGGSSESYVYTKSTLVVICDIEQRWLYPFTYATNGKISLTDFLTLTYLVMIPHSEWDSKTSN